MRIYVYLHLLCPEHNAGSETTVYAAMRAMARRGHQVKVICDRSEVAPYESFTLSSRKLVALRKPETRAVNFEESEYEYDQRIARASVVFPNSNTLTSDEVDEVSRWVKGELKGDGIQVVRPFRRGVQTWLKEYVSDGDLLITHLDLTAQAVGLALDTNKPLVHFAHNPDQLYHWHLEPRIGTAGCRLVVMNTDWLAAHYKWPGDQVTCRPVVEPEYYRCERGESITLANPTSGKGAPTFYQLAARMPERPFLTAQGGYGIQEKCQPQNRNLAPHVFYDDRGGELECFGLPNVTHVKNDPDVRNIFRRTKVLLMPSLAESYGRVGVEAACAGIPTICHPTPGLQEAFGEAGIFIDRDDIDGWHKEIDRLFTDEVYYRKRSDLVLELADSLDPESEFDRLEAALIDTVEAWMFQERVMNEKILLSNRRLGRTADGRLTDKMNEAISLVCGEAGQPIPHEFDNQATQLGFVQTPAIQTEVLLDTKGLNAKAVEGPQENKAIESPQANKRKRKTA